MSAARQFLQEHKHDDGDQDQGVAQCGKNLG